MSNSGHCLHVSSTAFATEECCMSCCLVKTLMFRWWSLLVCSSTLTIAFVPEQEVDDSWWFNDQYAVNDGTNTSKSIQKTWISSLFVGLWELPCIGHVDLRFSLDKGPFYAKGECVNVDSLLISTERFAFNVFRNGFETTGERSASGSPQQRTGGLCLSPKWSHNFNACARFKA